jgi:Ca-activated chloride channel family protein
LEDSHQKPRQADGGASIRVDVNLVLVAATVTDEMGRVVQGLGRENFKIFEDRTPQQIVSFSNEDIACSIGVVLDVSGSMNDKISKARLAIRALLDTANPQDEAFLITFADRPSLEIPFTSDVATIEDRAQFARSGGSTALIDAVYLALRHMRSARNSRKALLVISDGGDNNSRYSKGELRNFAMEADVQIHAVGIHDNPRASEEMNGTFLLEELTRITGGEHFIIRNIRELPDIAGKIGVALHEQYVIGYYPPADSRDGKWHRLQVKLALPKFLPPLQVYARSGYYALSR